jgi:hypothetical protein
VVVFEEEEGDGEAERDPDGEGEAVVAVADEGLSVPDVAVGVRALGGGVFGV